MFSSLSSVHLQLCGGERSKQPVIISHFIKLMDASSRGPEVIVQWNSDLKL